MNQASTKSSTIQANTPNPGELSKLRLPEGFIDEIVVESIPLDLWRELFDSIGWLESLGSASLGHPEIIRALREDEVGDDLVMLLQSLQSLGTEEGREAILEAADDVRIGMDWAPAGSSERELVARLFLRQREDAGLQEVYLRAQVKAQETLKRRRFFDYFGREVRPPLDIEAAAALLQREVVRYSRTKDFGEHITVDVFSDEDSQVFRIVRSHSMKKPIGIMEGAASRRPIPYRPVHSDVLRYSVASGRLRIIARSVYVAREYRKIMGRVLFEEDGFFDQIPAYDLSPFQKDGQRLLEETEMVGVGRVTLTSCKWERGNGEVLAFRSKDCFRLLEEMSLSIETGTLLEVTLKVPVAQRSTRPVSVTLRVPGKIEVSNGPYEDLIDQYLESIGVKSSGVSADRDDLWSLHPSHHPKEIWRVAFGDQLDELVVQGVFEQVQLETAPPSSGGELGRLLRPFEFREGEFYGVSDTGEVAPASLSPTDLDGLSFQPEAFRTHLQKKLGLTGIPGGFRGGPLMDLGTLTIEGHRFQIFYVLGLPDAGIGKRALQASEGRAPVLLVPAGRSTENSQIEVALDLPVPDRRELVRAVVVKAGLEGQMPATCLAPAHARLVVDTAKGKITVEGVAIHGLQPGTHPFLFVEAVARACPRAVSSTELNQKLSQFRGDGTTATRQAKKKAKDQILSALADAGIELSVNDPFQSDKGGYRCILPSYVR